MNKIFTHKLLPLFGLFLFVLNVFFINNVYASVVVKSANSEEIYTIPDFPGGESSCFIYKINDGGNAFLHVCYEEGSYFKINRYENGVYYFNCYNSSGQQVEFLTYTGYTGELKWRFAGAVQEDGFFSSVYETGVFGAVGTILNSDNSIFYSTNSKFEYPYIYQDVGDIERFLSSGIDIYPR